jgi:hypothetical protein
MIVKQKCPGCGRNVDTLYSWKKNLDSCQHCHPKLKGKDLSLILYELNERRKKESKRKK